MVRAILSLLLVALSPIGTRTIHAQNPSPALDTGSRIRVTGCLPACGTTVTGKFLRSDGDSLTLAVGDHTTTVSFTNLHRIEVVRAYRFNGKRALKVGGIVALAFGLSAYADAETELNADVIGMSAFAGLMGAIFAGGGKKAVRAGGIGALIAAPVVGILAAASYEPCTGSFCIFSSAGEVFVLGAAGGAIVGFAIGGAIGALTGGDTWQEVSWNGVSLIAAPTSGGLTVGASLEF